MKLINAPWTPLIEIYILGWVWFCLYSVLNVGGHHSLVGTIGLRISQLLWQENRTYGISGINLCNLAFRSRIEHFDVQKTLQGVNYV
jgi:hypothetical protein